MTPLGTRPDTIQAITARNAVRKNGNPSFPFHKGIRPLEAISTPAKQEPRASQPAYSTKWCRRQNRPEEWRRRSSLPPIRSYSIKHQESCTSSILDGKAPCRPIPITRTWKRMHWLSRRKIWKPHGRPRKECKDNMLPTRKMEKSTRAGLAETSALQTAGMPWPWMPRQNRAPIQPLSGL